MADPPVAAAVHETASDPAPAVTVKFVGALGTVRGATDVVHKDATPIPSLFTALTRNLYDVPFVRPVIVADVAVEVPRTNENHVAPPLVEYSIS